MSMFLILVLAYLIGEVVVRKALGTTRNAQGIIPPPEATKNRKAA